jgi:hypothetical protein
LSPRGSTLPLLPSGIHEIHEVFVLLSIRDQVLNHSVPWAG